MKKSTKTLLFVLTATVLLLSICALCACDFSLEYGKTAKLTVEYDSSHKVYEGDSLESLKPYLNVTYTDKEGNSSKITDFTLNGTLAKGQSSITVTYEGITYTVKVNVLESEAPNPNPNPNPQPTDDEYTVTFVADGQTVGTRKYTAQNKNITEPQVPAKTGYNGEWENYTLATGNVTVNAAYTAIEYTVTFVADGETVATQMYTVENKEITEPQVPVKTGYNGKWEYYELSAESICVNAIYSEKLYSVVFNSNGGSKVESLYNVKYGQTIVAPQQPTGGGYFIGWYDSRDKHLWNFAEEVVTKNLVLEAKYTAYLPSLQGITYTVIDERNPRCVVKSVPTTTDGIVAIPSAYKHYKVVGLNDTCLMNRTDVVSVILPRTIQYFGTNTFNGCTNLINIDLRACEALTTIDGFRNCSSLTSITIPNSVTSLNAGAFSGCSNLATVYWSATACESVGKYGYGSDNVFNDCPKLTNVLLGNNVNAIPEDAFENCSSLTSITIPNSVTSIGDYAFRNCSNLTKVNYKGAIADWCNISFGNYAANPLCYAHNLYVNNELVTELVIPDTVTEIKEYAFYGHTSITSATIGNCVTSIGKSAFSGCSGLKSVIVGKSAQSIGDYAFSGCSNMTKVNYLGAIVDWCNIRFGNCAANPLCYAHDLYINNKLITELEIPNGITEIKDYTFYDCASIASVIISDSVTSIGEEAFLKCDNIEFVSIPSALISSFCKTNLKTVVITTGRKIYGKEFQYCKKLESVVIPNSLTSIGAYAFDECECLSNIYYIGIYEEWKLINIASNNSCLTSATMYYYSEVEPSLNANGTAYNGNYWHYVDGEIVVWTYNKENN